MIFQRWRSSTAKYHTVEEVVKLPEIAPPHDGLFSHQKRKRHRWHLIPAAYGLLTLCLITLIALVGCFGAKWVNDTSVQDIGYDLAWGCAPDNHFIAYYGTGDWIYNPFATDQLFQVTISFGSLSLATAKLIDVIWDIVVGRGGQVLLLAVCCKPLLRIFLASMEQLVSLDVFVAQAFDLGGIATLWWQSLNLLGFSQGRKARSLAYLVVILLMTIYITSFGTMLSAFSGYRVLSKPIVDIGVPFPGTLIPVNDFVPISAFMYDSDRIGLPANKPVQKYLYYADDGGDRLYNALKDYLVDTEYLVRTSRYDTETNCTSEGTRWSGPPRPSDSSTTVNQCKCRWAELGIRSYDYPDTLCLRKEPVPLHAAPGNENGQFQLVEHDQGILSYRVIPSNRNSTFKSPNGTEISLTAPTLEIGALPIRPRYDGRGRLLAYKYPAPGRTAIYVDDYIARHTRCQTEDTYQWGFSILGLLVFLCLSLVFAFLFWAVWVDMKLNTHPAASGRDLDTYRAILDVAHVLERKLGRKLEGMSGGAIKRELEGKRIAVVLNTMDLPESKLRRRRRNMQGGMADDDDTDVKETVDSKEAYMTDIELMHLQTPPMHGNVVMVPPNDPQGQETEDAERTRGSSSGLRIM